MTSEDPPAGHQHAELVIEAGTIMTVDSRDTVLAAHSVVIGDGRIVALLPHAEARTRFAGANFVDRRDHLLMPGLINAHTHLAMNLLRGFSDDQPLKSWLQEHIWPAEAAHMSVDFVRDGTELALAECLLGGVTTVNDMYFFPDTVAEACVAAGVRATVGLLVIDFPSAWASTVDGYFDRGLAVHDQWRGHPLIRTLFAPHAPYTVSHESLVRVATLSAELDIGVHIHVHETAGEVRDYENAHGKRPLQHLDEIGLLGAELLAVHMTQLTAADIARLAETGVQVVHCPESNLKLASGFCPVAALDAAGVNICIGTDGAASNNDLDLFGETRSATLLAKAVAQDASVIPARQALRMMTINAARALGIDAIAGSLEPGKAADIIALNPDLGMLPMYDSSSQIAYATGRDRV